MSNENGIARVFSWNGIFFFFSFENRGIELSRNDTIDGSSLVVFWILFFFFRTTTDKKDRQNCSERNDYSFPL